MSKPVLKIAVQENPPTQLSRESLDNRAQVLRNPCVSGSVRSFHFNNKKWNRSGYSKLDLIFYVDRHSEAKVNGTDGLNRAMIFVSIGHVSFKII